MNETQRNQWNDYSCMSRALLKAASLRNIQITEDEFCTRYEKLFPCPNQYGGLILSRFFAIAKEMGLCEEMDWICHFSDVKKTFNQSRLIFVLSGIYLHKERDDEFNHMSVLIDIQEDTFTVDECPTLAKSDWVDKRCSGIVFF